ncbi:MAG: response regulator transcription factor [Elusimicrobia bacterium]|nr:response regulator transcription factor [Elusimicrobiota bacterium]
MAKKILIVDDDSNIRTMNGFILMKHGFDVCFASDGATALARIHKENFDLILLDLKLPFVSGSRIIEVSRQQNVKLPPVIVISGLDEEFVKEECDRFGLREYIIKPYTQDALIERIKKVLS